MNWWHRLLRQSDAEEPAPDDSAIGCRSTIIPPPPSSMTHDSPATLRVPRVPEPANDLRAWTDDTIVRDLAIDEDLGWDEPETDRPTLRREGPFRAASPTWKCRVA